MMSGSSSEQQYERNLYMSQQYAERVNEIYENDKKRYIRPLDEAERLKK